MDFRINNGPWETVFSGKAYGHEIEVVKNPEDFFLVLAFDFQEGRKIGALVEGYKAFVARGQMEAFIQTFPKPCMGIAKTLGDATNKILFISFEPLYLDFREDDFVRKLDQQISNSFDALNTITDLARTSSLELREASMSPKEEYSMILGDPFIFRALLGGQANSLEEKGPGQMQKESRALIQLGLNKAREIISESTEELKITFVTGEKRQSIAYCIYIISENFMLENKPAIIFDSTNYFSGIGTPSDKRTALSDSMVEFEPIGFPVKRFLPKENIKISLKNVDMLLLMGLLGVHDEEFEKELSLASFSFGANTPVELAEKVLKADGISDFRRLKAERMLRIVDQDFPKMFGETINVDELTKKWPGNLGRATLVDMQKLSIAEKVVFTQAILRLISKTSDERTNNDFVLVIPEAEEILSANKDRIVDVIMSLENQGVSLLLGAKQKPTSDLTETINTTISIVNENDVAVSVKNKRNYRVILRPSLSGNPKP